MQDQLRHLVSPRQRTMEMVRANLDSIICVSNELQVAVRRLGWQTFVLTWGSWLSAHGVKSVRTTQPVRVEGKLPS